MSLAPKIAEHAASAGHWYRSDGSQVEQVPSADGKKLVTPDLRHARKLDLGRGCTSIIKLAAKPDLVRWQQRQAILAALTLPRRDTETEEAWLSRVEEDMGATAKAAAEEGTRVHAAVQAHVAGELPIPGYEQAAVNIVDYLHGTLGIQKWTSEQSYASTLGYGAKLDLVSPHWIIDMKGKDTKAKEPAAAFAELQDLSTYDEHEIQLAAQRHAARMPSARCGILFFSRNVPGVCFLREVEEDALRRGMRMFKALLRLSFEKDYFRPSWAIEE